MTPSGIEPATFRLVAQRRIGWVQVLFDTFKGIPAEEQIIWSM
jgi:hypothetical protein